MLKFQVDVRVKETQTDRTILETNSFREAVAKYDELRGYLANELGVCTFDIVIMYVRADDLTPAGDAVSMVASSIETKVVEW